MPRTITLLVLVAAVAGCYESILVNPGIECPVTAHPHTVVMPRAREVDLLFVVDNSNSMEHAQRIFSESFPEARRSDRDGGFGR